MRPAPKRIEITIVESQLMKCFLQVTVLVLSGSFFACSGGHFKKNESTQSADASVAVAAEAIAETTSPANADAAVSSEPVTTSETAVAATTSTQLKEEDKSALSECLKQWTSNPFTPAEIALPKVVNINEVVNNNSLIFSDDKITSKPSLFLVNFNITVGNNGELNFLNPKGYYCFNVKAKIINNFVINAACDTHVAIVSKLAQNDKNFAIKRPDPCPKAP